MLRDCRASVVVCDSSDVLCRDQLRSLLWRVWREFVNRYNDDVDDQHPSRFQRLFQPARSRSIPYVRAWNIALRTAHLMGTSMLVGGYAFGASADQLKPLLYLSIATGVGLAVVEAYPSLHFVFEGWGLFLLSKLALLGLVPFAHRYRVTILLAIIALAAVGSHMPARFRHYSLLYRKTIER